jgi:hypothetical protein
VSAPKIACRIVCDFLKCDKLPAILVTMIIQKSGQMPDSSEKKVSTPDSEQLHPGTIPKKYADESIQCYQSGLNELFLRK